MRILVVEDDLEAQRYLVQGLKESGHVVDDAADGDVGLNLALSRPYDIAIIDRMLPKMDGLGVVAEMREHGNTTPVLFLSALSLRSNNTECPTDTTYSVDELFGIAEELWTTAIEASVVIDGEPVAGLEDPQTTPYLFRTGPFPITLADHDNQLAANGLTCVPDGITIEPNVAIGVFLMVRPLPIGSHTIQIRGVAGPEEDPAFTKDVTYQIEVVPR